MPSSIHPTASSPIRERNPSADRSEQSGDPRAFHHGFGAKFTHTTSRRPKILQGARNSTPGQLIRTKKLTHGKEGVDTFLGGIGVNQLDRIAYVPSYKQGTRFYFLGKVTKDSQFCSRVKHRRDRFLVVSHNLVRGSRIAAGSPGSDRL